MRRLLFLLLLIAIPSPAAALAGGCPASVCGTTSVAPPGSQLTLIRRNGQQGTAEGFDLATGARSFRLPNGILAADGKTFVSARNLKVSAGRRTLVSRYDAQTGRLRSVTALPGTWNVVGTTADARRVAVIQYRKRSIVLGVSDRAVRFRRVLRGNWEVEGLSPNGARVFLVHWNRSGGYTLENIDTRTNRLASTRLDEPDEKMSGFAQSAIATRDGRWLLTLYLKPEGTTFIHALDLRTGLAHCIDLTLRGDPATVGSTALALSPDERKLYLANPFLGRVTTVDLVSFRPTRDVRFQRLSPRQLDISVGPSAAVTGNGRMLAFSGARSAWFYDTAYGVVRRPVEAGSPIVGIGFGPDGRKLMTISDAGSRAFDAATGRRVR